MAATTGSGYLYDPTQMKVGFPPLLRSKAGLFPYWLVR